MELNGNKVTFSFADAEEQKTLLEDGFGSQFDRRQAMKARNKKGGRRGGRGGGRRGRSSRK